MSVSAASLEPFTSMINEVASLGHDSSADINSYHLVHPFRGVLVCLLGCFSKVSHSRKDCLPAYSLHNLLLTACICRLHPVLTTWSCSLQSCQEAPRIQGTLCLVIHACNCFPRSLIQAMRMCLSCFKETGNLS